jgi:hypothetical protein
MRITRLGRLLRRLAFLVPLVMITACASSDASGGPSEDRTWDIVAITLGAAAIIALGALMYHDNKD